MRERPTKRYIVRYQDESGLSGIIEWWCFAFDALHAEEMFYEGIDSDGWEVVSVDRPKLPRGKVDTQYDRPGSGRPRSSAMTRSPRRAP